MGVGTEGEKLWTEEEKRYKLKRKKPQGNVG